MIGLSNEPVERAWRLPESDHDVAGRFLATSFDRCCSAEEVQARVEAIESAYDALIGRLGSAGFDPTPFKARKDGSNCRRRGREADREVKKAAERSEGGRARLSRICHRVVNQACTNDRAGEEVRTV